MSKPTSVTGSESEFEFIETPKPTAPTFEKEEDCGVRTTKVCLSFFSYLFTPAWVASYMRLQ